MICFNVNNTYKPILERTIASVWVKSGSTTCVHSNHFENDVNT
jgi:hypothetical protein